MKFSTIAFALFSAVALAAPAPEPVEVDASNIAVVADLMKRQLCGPCTGGRMSCCHTTCYTVRC